MHAGGKPVICNHDSLHKFDATRFGVWLQSARMSGAVIQLLAQSSDAEQRLQATAATAGVNVTFRERLGVDAHLKNIGACAVAVDTDGISAHTTAANYMYSGVPVVSSPSEHQVCVFICMYVCVFMYVYSFYIRIDALNDLYGGVPVLVHAAKHQV